LYCLHSGINYDNRAIDSETPIEVRRPLPIQRRDIPRPRSKLKANADHQLPINQAAGGLFPMDEENDQTRILYSFYNRVLTLKYGD